jgi:hypothetical protein
MCVLDTPGVVDDGVEILTHYYRSYFVVALSAEDAMALLREDVRADGATLLSAGTPEPCSASDVPVSRYEQLKLDRKRGVRWRSGRAFFPAD